VPHTSRSAPPPGSQLGALAAAGQALQHAAQHLHGARVLQLRPGARRLDRRVRLPLAREVVAQPRLHTRVTLGQWAQRPARQRAGRASDGQTAAARVQLRGPCMQLSQWARRAGRRQSPVAQGRMRSSNSSHHDVCQSAGRVGARACRTHGAASLRPRGGGRALTSVRPASGCASAPRIAASAAGSSSASGTSWSTRPTCRVQEGWRRRCKPVKPPASRGDSRRHARRRTLTTRRQAEARACTHAPFSPAMAGSAGRAAARLLSLLRRHERGELAQPLGAGLPDHARHEPRPVQRHADTDRHLIEPDVARAIGHDAQVAAQRQAAPAGRASAADGRDCDQRRAVQPR